MATITITKQWANGEILLEADLDFIKSDVETFLNVTKINDDNIQNAGITASSKLIDGTISTAKLQNAAVTATKLATDSVTTIKILDANVTAAKLAADVTTAFVPPGIVWSYTGTAAPSGWLLCDGSAISRTTFSALFAITSTTFGVGDGSTTFNIPDIRGRVIAGQDDMGGTSANRLTGLAGGIDGDVFGGTGGGEGHILSVAQMPVHSHGGVTGTTNMAIRNDGATTLSGVFDMVRSDQGNDSPEGHNHSISSEGSGTTHNNVQPTIILNYIIKT